ncbi:MAG TPA: hypothetical protein P5556_05405 [Candidatus Gastranaerophilales bacterium]|nr:hypothetical protein [Candidatus Gastranaerophilales bacterium]
MEILLDLLSPINLIFTGIIIYLTIEDLRSFKSRDYRNYKSLIFSVGILGTFTGIFWGLLNFDSKDITSIQTSIPQLLSGLKTAFITSILGMIAGLALTFAQKKFFDTSYSEDSVDILRSIEIKLSSLKDIHSIYDVNIDLLKEINSIKDDIYDVNKQMLNTLTVNFEKTNITLDNAIEKLSSDSSKEIVNSLEKIITQFNTSMVDQFGQNFKEFNEAVSKLLNWQAEYKDSLVQMNENLSKAVNAIEATDSSLSSIAGKNEEIIKVYQMFGEMIQKSEDQAYEINTKILAQIELLEVIQNVFNDTKYKFAEFVKEFSDGSNQLLGGFVETKNSMDKISGRINSSLGQQSESLKKLSDQLEQELPKSLGMLDKSLTALTEGFKNDYKTFLEYYKQLVISQD